MSCISSRFHTRTDKTRLEERRKRRSEYFPCATLYVNLLKNNQLYYHKHRGYKVITLRVRQSVC